MSLLSEAYEPCVIMDKTTEKDGYGGDGTVWREGAEIQAAITPDGGIEQILAQQKEWSGSYNVVTSRSVQFMSGDVFKRLSDGKVFRVKSDGTDEKTPKSAGLDMRVVKAEEYKL